MSIVTVSNSAELQTALSAAQGGDTIQLAAGNYGDVLIKQNYSADVTITSLNTSSPAVFHTLDIESSSHLRFTGVAVNFTATASTILSSPAVTIMASSNISFLSSTITGSNPVNGVAQSATTLDSTGNVLGLPTGYGMTISKSTGVVVDAVAISHVNKGIALINSSYVTVSHNDIGDLRTSGIVGGGSGSHIIIDSNHIHDSHPWQWGAGDHADYLALWTDPAQTGASTDIKITNNVFEQGNGTAILGMWMQGGDAGFSGVSISGNTFLIGNNQGIVLWDVANASIDHNTMLQSNGADWKSAPAILLSGGAEAVTVHDNFTAATYDQSGSTGALANSLFDNHLIQKWNAAAAGYYSSALVTLVDQITNYSTIYSFASQRLPGLGLGDAIALGETLSGGLGDDLLVSTGVLGGSSIAGGAGADTIWGGPVSSIIRGEDGADVIHAQHGFNDVNGNAGADTIFGGDGGDWLVGGRDNDAIYGGGGDQILYGNMGDDTLIGGAGAEILRGGQGNDSISGGAGKDWLSGDLGSDTISGGAGADTFHISKGAGIDMVTDFSSAQGDRVQLDPGSTYTLRFDGANMVVDLGGGDQMILVGITPSTIGTWLAA